MPYSLAAREGYTVYVLEKSARKIITSSLTVSDIRICGLRYSHVTEG